MRPEPPSRGAIVPPYSLEAEQGVLGGLLIDNRALDRVASILRPEHFYSAEHRRVFAEISRQVNAGRPADIVTVYEALGPTLRDSETLSYLNAMAQSVPSASNVRRYAEIIVDKAQRRRVLELTMDLREAVAGDEPREITDAVGDAVTELLALLQGRDAREPVHIEQALMALVDQVNAMAEGKMAATSTGLRDIDEPVGGGFRAGELWVLGARPSMGKSAMALTVSLAVGSHSGVLFLTQEDALTTLAGRAVAHAGRVNLADVRNPVRAKDPDQFYSGLAEGVDIVSSRKLYVDEQAGLTLADVRRKVQQAQRLCPDLFLVVVDYLQLMRGDNDNRNQLLGEISNGLKQLAKDMGVCVLLLSQLSRKADEVAGVPQLSHLRDSGDIEGAADVVMLLFREFMRKPTPENKHWAQAHMAKVKNGRTCIVDLFFDGAFLRFGNWDGPPPKSVLGRSGGGGSVSSIAG